MPVTTGGDGRGVTARSSVGSRREWAWLPSRQCEAEDGDGGRLRRRRRVEKAEFAARGSALQRLVEGGGAEDGRPPRGASGLDEQRRTPRVHRKQEPPANRRRRHPAADRMQTLDHEEPADDGGGDEPRRVRAATVAGGGRAVLCEQVEFDEPEEDGVAEEGDAAQRGRGAEERAADGDGAEQ